MDLWCFCSKLTTPSEISFYVGIQLKVAKPPNFAPAESSCFRHDLPRVWHVSGTFFLQIKIRWFDKMCLYLLLFQGFLRSFWFFMWAHFEKCQRTLGHVWSSKNSWNSPVYTGPNRCQRMAPNGSRSLSLPIEVGIAFQSNYLAAANGQEPFDSCDSVFRNAKCWTKECVLLLCFFGKVLSVFVCLLFSSSLRKENVVAVF